MEKYTVLMSVYYKDNPKWLEESINSMINQTIKPDEILLLQDGPLTKELEDKIKKIKKNKMIRVIPFEKNRGLGPVLEDGVKLAKNNLIARMDSDDISEKNRCELQLKKFAENENLAIVGGAVSEFLDDDINNIVSMKNMPEKNKDIHKYAHKRNPFAHPTVMFKKDKVLEAGNYKKCDFFEDYDLWSRMIEKKFECYNIQKKLVNMRVSRDFYDRRGGIQYLKKILKFKYTLYKERKFYSLKEFIISAGGHSIVCLMPRKIRYNIYTNFLRKEK